MVRSQRVPAESAASGKRWHWTLRGLRAASQRPVQRMTTLYDEVMYQPLLVDFYKGADYFNYGYWTAETRNQVEASDQLMERLLAALPEKRGSILDVACGMGASSRYLTKYFEPSAIVGLNVSHKQLGSARRNAPGANFVLMDAARLGFPDAHFDNVICVEAAAHFDTRETFIREAYRVLKPGGHLLVSDTVFRRFGGIGRNMPAENFVPNLRAYRDHYLNAGFRDVEVVDAMQACFRGWRRNLARFVWQKLRAREVPLRHGFFVLTWLAGLSALLKHYPLVSATKSR